MSQVAAPGTADAPNQVRAEVLRHVRLDQTKITYEVGVFIHLLQPKLDANSQLIMNI